MQRYTLVSTITLKCEHTFTKGKLNKQKNITSMQAGWQDDYAKTLALEQKQSTPNLREKKINFITKTA